MRAKGRGKVTRSMERPHNVALFLPCHERDQIPSMPCTPQAGGEFIASREAARSLRNRRHGRFNLSDERQGSDGIIERYEIGNINQIGPCRQQKLIRHVVSGLASVAGTQLGEHFLGGDAGAAVQPCLDRIAQGFQIAPLNVTRAGHSRSASRTTSLVDA